MEAIDLKTYFYCIYQCGFVAHYATGGHFKLSMILCVGVITHCDFLQNTLLYITDRCLHISASCNRAGATLPKGLPQTGVRSSGETSPAAGG